MIPLGLFCYELSMFSKSLVCHILRKVQHLDEVAVLIPRAAYLYAFATVILRSSSVVWSNE